VTEDREAEARQRVRIIIFLQLGLGGQRKEELLLNLGKNSVRSQTKDKAKGKKKYSETQGTKCSQAKVSKNSTAPSIRQKQKKGNLGNEENE